MSYSRKQFLKQVAGASLALPFYHLPLPTVNSSKKNEELEVHLFSKHLHFLEIADAAKVAKQLGFAGLDLTIRPKGHVLPEQVSQQLPLAVEAIHKEGLLCRMITTAIESATHPTDVAIIQTAAQLGVEFYRSNWFKYQKNKTMDASLTFYQEIVEALSALNRTHGIIGCYQNHSGTSIGASVWEINHLLETADPTYFGAQYDIRHAVAEGGQSWPNGVRLLKGRIKTIVLKDFIWGNVDGQWKPVNVPIGEGMVDFTRYFKLLKQYRLTPPVSLHLEYPLGGAEKGNTSLTIHQDRVFEAMKKDLTTLQRLWQEA